MPHLNQIIPEIPHQHAVLLGVDPPLPTQIQPPLPGLEDILKPIPDPRRHTHQQRVNHQHHEVQMISVDLLVAFFADVSDPRLRDGFVVGVDVGLVYQETYDVKHVHEGDQFGPFRRGGRAEGLEVGFDLLLQAAEFEEVYHDKTQRQPLHHLVEAVCAEVHARHRHEDHESQGRVEEL